MCRKGSEGAWSRASTLRRHHCWRLEITLICNVSSSVIFIVLWSLCNFSLISDIVFYSLNNLIISSVYLSSVLFGPNFYQRTCLFKPCPLMSYFFTGGLVYLSNVLFGPNLYERTCLFKQCIFCLTFFTGGPIYLISVLFGPNFFTRDLVYLNNESSK